jgi:putative protease
LESNNSEIKGIDNKDEANNSIQRRMIELLSPARDFRCGKSAIDCGADALYIGAPKFGARKSASNSIEDIAELIAYAHKYFVRVYPVINTILYDSEIESAVNLSRDLAKIGADALIIQDFALLRSPNMPDIPLFASTQTNNYSTEKIKLLESLGFSRAILARELSLAQIEEISINTNIELETFVFGALCVSLSGACNMSYALKGRSANRGECAQLCRMKYSLLDGDKNIISDDKYLLSLKDLNLENKIGELLDVGVSSFKIEGRLKDETYAANSTAYFRKKIDEALKSRPHCKRSSSGLSYINFTPDLEKCFNRGFTEFNINGEAIFPASIDSPKSIGKFIGSILEVNGNSIKVDAQYKINPGDGICFYDEKSELKGFRVNSVKDDIIKTYEPVNVKVGAKIYRNQDEAFEKQILKLDSSRKIAVNIQFNEYENGFRLSAVDEDGVSGEVEVESNKTKAENLEQSQANIYKQLSKTGDTPFETDMIEIASGGDLFIPMSALNSARRQLLKDLEYNRSKKVLDDRAKRKKLSLDTSIDLESTKESLFAANEYSREFYEEIGLLDVKKAMELQEVNNDAILMTSKYCLKKQFGLCKKYGAEKSIKEPLTLSDGQNIFKLEFDCVNCFMNIKYIE